MFRVAQISRTMKRVTNLQFTRRNVMRRILAFLSLRSRLSPSNCPAKTRFALPSSIGSQSKFRIESGPIGARLPHRCSS